MTTENLSTLKIHKLTQAQYNRELEAGNIDANALYLTPDEVIDLSGYATAEQLNVVRSELDNKADVDSNGYVGVSGVNASEQIVVSNGETAMALYVNGLGSPTGNVWIDSAGEGYFTEVYIGSIDKHTQLHPVYEFDLASMGLAALTPGGDAVTLTTNTSTILTAMAAGHVRFLFQFVYGGVTLNGNAVVAPLYMKESGEYQGVAMVVLAGSPTYLCFTVDSTKITARCDKLGTQSKITGSAGQFVVIGSDGNPTTVSLTNVAEVGA